MIFCSRTVDGEKEFICLEYVMASFSFAKSLAEHKMSAFSETIRRSQKPRGESMIYDY